MTVLVLRPTGQPSVAPLPARVRGIGRLAWAIVTGLAPGGRAIPLPDLKLANVGGAVLPGSSAGSGGQAGPPPAE